MKRNYSKVALPIKLCVPSPAVVHVQEVENHCSKPYVERTVDFYTPPAFKKICCVRRILAEMESKRMLSRENNAEDHYFIRRNKG